MVREPKERHAFQKKPLNNGKKKRRDPLIIKGTKLMLPNREHQSPANAEQACRRYSGQDIDCYIHQELPRQALTELEDHVQQCEACRQEVEAARLKEGMDNERYLTKAMMIMDALDEGKNERDAKAEVTRLEIFQSVLEVLEDSIHVLATTGQIQPPPAPCGKRLTDRDERVKGAIKILQELKNHLAALVVVSRGIPGNVICTVTLYDRSVNDFLSEATLILVKDQEVLSRQTTDANGKAMFDLVGSGVYAISLIRDKKRVGAIHLIIEAR